MQDRYELSETERRDGKALWAAATTAHATPPGAPLDPLTLAAYLDGRLDEAARDRLEGELAASPLGLETFLAADAALGAGLAPSQGLLARAAALVPGEALPRRGLLGRLLGGGAPRSEGFRLRPVSLAAALALVLVVAFAGFEIGRFGYAAAAESYFPENDGFGLSAEAGL